MMPKHRRLAGIMLMLLILSTAMALTLTALEESVVFFHSPTDIATRDDLQKDRRMRIGGLVKEESLRREDGGVRVSFVITDLENEVRVQYRGILPDLFREGQGIVAEGRLATNGSFLADQVLAKHDENYMPPEVADALRKSGQ